MKKLYIFLGLLFTMLALGDKGWGQTATYTITSTSTVSTSGSAPGGSSSTYSQTYTTAGKMTSGNSTTLTLTGYTGCTITSIDLSMGSNASGGSGNLSAIAGVTTIASISTAGFNTASWYGSWSGSPTYVDILPAITPYLIGLGESVVITINATANSLYIQSYAITYTAAPTGPTVALASASPAVAAGNVYIGSTSNNSTSTNVLSAFNTAITVNNGILSSIAVTTAGSYTAITDVVNYKLYYNTSNSLSGASQIGTTVASGVASGGTVTFSGLSTTINSGTTGYFWVLADIAGTATAGKTINIAASPTITFSPVAVSTSGSISAGGAQTFTAAPTPVITIADNAPQVTAASVAQGTLNVVLHQSQLTVTTANATLTGMTCTTAGNYISADVINLKVWYSNSSTFSTGGSTLLSTYTTPGAAGAKTFPSFASQIINSGTTGFIYITADIATGATVGHAINVNALTTGNFTFSSGSVSGSTTIGGTQTFSAASAPVITLADNGAPDNDYQVVAGYVAKGATNVILHQSQLGVATGFAILTGMTCTTAGSYASADITNLKVWYSNSSTFSAGGSTLLSTYTTPGVAGTKTFPAFTSQTIYNGTTGYIYITADIAAGATAGHTINVNALTTANFTFSSGSKSGSTTAGGLQTIATCAITSTATGGLWSATSTWVGGVVPTSTCNVNIVSGAVVTLDDAVGADVTINSLTLNGTLLYTTINYGLIISGTTTVSGTGEFDDFGKYVLLEGTTEVMNGGYWYAFSNGTNWCGELIIANGVTMTVDAGGALSCNNTYSSYAYNVLDLGTTADAYLVINGTLYINNVTTAAGCIWTYNGDGDITIGNGGTCNFYQGTFANPTFPCIVYAATGSNLVFSGGSCTSVVALWPAAAALYPPYNVTVNSSGTITTDAAKTINGTLTLQAGTLAYGGTLTMGAGSTIYRSAGTLSFTSLQLSLTNYNLDYDNFAANITTGTECVPNATSTTALKNLTIESSGGYGVTLNAPTTVNTALTLTSGILTTTAAHSLTISNTATSGVSGGSTTSFVDGPLIWVLPAGLSASASVYTFPLGAGGTYLPISYTTLTTAATGPIITAQAYGTGPTGTADGSTITNVSSTEYWLTSASVPANYTSGSVSLTRQTALGSFALIGRSSNNAALSYGSIGGTPSGTSINNSNVTANSLGYLAMGCPPTTNYYWGGTTGNYTGAWTTGTPWGTSTASGATKAWPAAGSYSANFNTTTGGGGVATIPSSISVVPFNVLINAANNTFNTSGSTGALTAPIALGANTLTLAPVSAAYSLTLSGIISGTGGISNTTGTSILSGANTYTGTTTLSSGTLDINNATAIGTGTFTITTGTIDNTSGSAITLSNNNVQNWNGDFTFTGTNALNIGTGAVAMNAARQVTVSSGTLTTGGIISGATFRLTKAGSGALTLSGANTYTGGTTLSAGTLNINNASALGTIAGTFIINGGTIDNTTAGSITTVNYPQTWGGDFTFTGSQNLNLGTGVVSMSASRTVTISSNTLTVGGVILGAFSLTKTGAGTLTLSGANSYSGKTIITSGTLALGATNTLPSGKNVILNGGILSGSATYGQAGLGTLGLTDNSTIALGAGTSTLAFANSSSNSGDATWTGGKTLTITGWTGTATTGPGTGGRIFFGGAAGTLTAGQLAQISFTGYTGAMLTASGELVPVSAPCSAPTTQASGFSTNTVTTNSMNYAFTRGNGNDVLVICKAGSAPTAPTCGTTYSASATYGSGTAVGGGYCVYNGTAAGISTPTGNIAITGLTGGTTYYFEVYEYNTTGTCYDLTALTGSATTTTCQTMNGYPHPQLTGFVINSCKTGTGCAADESLEEGSNEMCIFNSGPTPIPVTNSATAAANIALYYGSTIGSGDWENYSSSYVSDPVGYCALLNTTAGCGHTLFIDALTAGTIPANSIFLITSQSPNYPYNFNSLCGICPYIYVLFSISPYWTCCAHEEGGRTGNFANTASGIRYFGTSITDNTSVNTTWYYQYNPGTSGQAWSPDDTPGDEISYDIATSSNATSGNPLAPSQYFTNACTSVGTTILPINLLSFTADCNTLNQTVNINWSTASETNNDYFTIERSKDGETWEIVTVVKGAGNSNDLINYNVNDDAPSSTVSYYRLKQTDFNGVSNTFNPVAVSCNSNATDYFVLKPNPAIDEVTCSVVASEDNNATIEIINYLGQKICIKNCNLLKGSNDFKVDVSPFSNGMYTVIVYSSNGKLIDTKQLVVQKR